MRKFWKILLRCLGVIVVLGLVWGGIFAYNSNRYKLSGYPMDPAAVAQRGDVEQVSGNYLQGFYYPAKQEAHKGIVVVFGGSDGGNNDIRARELREQGYNVLGLYFFGQPGQPEGLADVPLDFFAEALDWIRQHGDINAPITVFGGVERRGIGG
ncbi:MAG: hypothetical protein Q4A82_03685 [Corynebacterium sp.]|nr:hypothetical protein [Corynebacterium sp.]